MSLRSVLSTPDGKARYVRWLFREIAPRYDFITGCLSYGRDRRWKAKLIQLAGVTVGTRVLDAATGTGDLAFAAAQRGAQVIGLDITPGMIRLARQKAVRFRESRHTTATGPHFRSRVPEFVVADMMALPFPGGFFDVVTTGYGLRNVPDLTTALMEINRVLRPGGKLLSLDFNRPESAPVRLVYFTYLTIVGSILGLILHRNPNTYRYIPESLRRYPGAAAVAQEMQRRGFVEAVHVPVLGGLLSIHVARKG